MKIAILTTLVFASLNSFAGVPNSPDAVEVIKTKDLLQYQNIPVISKEFKGERNSTDTSVIEKQCQDWVYAQVQSLGKNVFRTWCTRKKDIVLREYVYIGNVLIKTWK